MDEVQPALDGRHSDIRSFLSLSARLGGDPGLIQASGGNTSCKAGNVLWVKASGKSLADAEREPIFVAVDLRGVRGAIKAGEADPVSRHVVGEPALRPSIETTLHALLPHRFVFHVHSVAALSWTVRTDGEARLTERLRSLDWAWVPYARPGLPLTRATAQAATSGPHVLMLQNHGVVVGGETCAEVERRLGDIEARLARDARPVPVGPSPALAAVADGRHFRLPADPVIHALARDPAMLAMASQGCLYPDHVVFLGPTMAVAPAPDRAAEAAQRARGGLAAEPPLLLVPGHGALLLGAPRFGVEAMLRCLADVLARVPPGAALRYLTDAEIGELVHWDAEAYRRAMHA